MYSQTGVSLQHNLWRDPDVPDEVDTVVDGIGDELEGEEDEGVDCEDLLFCEPDARPDAAPAAAPAGAGLLASDTF